uniref:GK21411 n=1 Tax=Drosophila willistoni TaxID=7260 RepID=B4MQK6_DROWI
MSEPKSASRCESPSAVRSFSIDPKSNRTTDLRALSNASASRKSRMPSRLPVRSHSLSGSKKNSPKSGPIRATSPSPAQLRRSAIKKPDVVSTGDNVTKTETEKPKTICKPKLEPRSNKIAQQRLSRATSAMPAKTNVRKVILPPEIDNKKKQGNVKATAVPTTATAVPTTATAVPENRVEPLPSATPTSSRVIQTNAARAFEAQHKKLQDFQSEFMRKLSQLGRLGQHKSEQYKFVAVVMNEKCKLVVKDDNLVGMPKFLPAESVFDLKQRCRRMVDSGFAMMSDNLASIHKAKDETEANAARDKLLNKMQVYLKQEIATLLADIDRMCGPSNSKLSALQSELNDVRAQKNLLDSRILEIRKEHSSAMNQLRVNQEKAMSTESEKRDKIIANLEKSLTEVKKNKEQMELDYKKERGDMLSPLQHDNSIDLAKRDEIIADLEETVKKYKDEMYCLEKRLYDSKKKQADPNEKSEIAKRDQIISDLKNSLREAMVEKQKIEISHNESSSQTVELCENDENISELKDALLEAQKKNKQFEEVCAEHKKIIHKLRMDHTVSMSTESGRRERAFIDLKQNLRQAEDRTLHFERLYNDSKAKITELKNQVKQMSDKPTGTEKKKIIGGVNKCLVETRKELLAQTDVLAQKKPLDKDSQKAMEFLNTEAEKLKTINTQMQSSLEKANENLELSRKNIEANEERISFLENELKKASELIPSPNHLDAGLLAANRTIADLKSQVISLEQHRNVISEEVKKLMAQHEAFDELTTKFKESQIDISELKEKLKATESQLMKRTESELKLRNELNLSKEELCKFEDQVNRLSEQLERDKQLLDVRSEMINTLQKNEAETSSKLEHMYSEFKQKKETLTQVNGELISRNEEFRNLFGTLSSKQMEVRRQNHIIKLLEENNKRGSMLRIKQEERNAVMQDEIFRLRSSM